MGVEIREQKSVTRYLLWGSAVVIIAYLLANWAVMVTVPVKTSASTPAVAQAVGIALGSVAG
jgi:glutamate:GABA antiporter